MRLIVLNHTSSAGINGFHEQAILATDISLNFDSPVISAEGFVTSPGMATRAMYGEDIYPNKGKYSHRTQLEIDEDIEDYLSTRTHKFLIPWSSVAYVKDFEEG